MRDLYDALAYCVNPKRFRTGIHAVRVEHVCKLISDPKNRITTAAFEVGFQSISQLNRVFRRLKGISPRHWRQEHLHLPA